MIIAKERITHNGVTYEPNSEIMDISEKEAERLVRLNVAFFISSFQKSTSGKENNDANLKGNDEEDSIEFTPEEAAKELDELFDYNGLKNASIKVGLEFPKNISKANLIKLIIEQRKVDEVFDLLEDEI